MLKKCDRRSVECKKFSERICSGAIWFCGVKVMGRSVIVILPTTVSMSKLDEELGKSLESSFSSLFL
jgi:hypothetical protein